MTYRRRRRKKSKNYVPKSKSLQLIEKEQEEQTGELDLSWLDLVEVPKEIVVLKNLTRLNLEGNDIKDIEPLIQLKKLKELNLGCYSLIEHNYHAKYENLSSLSKLEVLNLNCNLLIDYEFIKSLKNLKSLSLSHTNFKDTTILHDLIHLEYLDLSWNNIKNIDALNKLQELQYLNLSWNKISNADVIKNFIKLKKLDLYSNSIKFFKVNNLKNLTNLDIRFNQIEILNIQNLSQLETLDCTCNSIEEVRIDNLEHLKYIDLKQLNISKIKISNCPSLCRINLSANNLKNLSQLTYIIKELDIPASLKRLPKGYNIVKNSNKKRHQVKQLFIGGNRFVVPPPKIIRKGNKAILNYFDELEKGEIINNRVKMILVGNGRVGKTSLLKRLQNEPFDTHETYTHGIQIGQLQKEHLPNTKTEGLHLNVWDFGGQEIFYATHQFFLSDEALYLLSWTDETNVQPHRERDKEVLPFNEKWQSNEYWLESIRLRSKTSPILMVQTHIDCYDTEIPLPKQAWKNNPYNATCLNYSAATNENFERLKRTITHKINNELPLYGKPFPKTYNRVIEEIDRLKNEDELPFITYDYFVNTVCRDANINEGGEATLCAYLNNTGVVVHYPNLPNLKDKVYINPNWLTQQVYQLINNRLRALEGKISETYLETHLPDYQETGLVELLKAFELIFEVHKKAERYYIAPQYLPETYESEILDLQKERSELAFVFRFPKFIPDNVIVNFLARYGSFSQSAYWKTGIFFTKYQSSCIVEQKENSLLVYTDKSGNHHQLQREICQTFVELSHHANAHLSLDENMFVDFITLEKHYRDKYREITSVCGKKLEMSNYLYFFEEPKTALEMSFRKRKNYSQLQNITIMKIEGGININGGTPNIQIADVINNGISNLSDIDKRLLKMIYDNTSSDEEREELIKHFSVVKSQNSSTDEKEQSGGLIKKFLESAAVEGGKQMVKDLVINGADYVQYLM